MSLLEFDHLNVTYQTGRSNYAVRDVSFAVPQGRAVGVVGESGSGKSTIMHAALRILNPKIASVSGRVLLDGENLLEMDEKKLAEIRWRKMAVVFQKSMNALSPVHRVGTFMSDVYRVHEQAATKAQAMQRVNELLEMVSLPSARVAKLYPHELSGGMMQRVSIALSLMFNPNILILDEATTALDVVTQTQILDEIIKIEKQLGLTRLMVTHDISVVACTCQDIAVLYAGKLVEFGPVETVLVTPSHPYTQCLLESFPSANAAEQGVLKSIPGVLPDLHEPPKGCIFAPRCPHVMQRCRTEQPPMYMTGQNQRAACHLLEGCEKYA